jgi:hypothetical protein
LRLDAAGTILFDVRTRATVIALVLASAAGAAGVPDGWTTYRSDRFGWELSYPASVVLTPYFGGQSGDLSVAASGAALAAIEVWPGDLCPRERSGMTAEALGVERVSAVTQADGDDGSSSCGAPVALRRFSSDAGVRLYEATLTCTAERRVHRRIVRTREGRKGPTFFADISQPWRRRVLTIDPSGLDPRMGSAATRADPTTLRAVLATLRTFAVPDPHVVCIDDVGPVGGARAGP